MQTDIDEHERIRAITQKRVSQRQAKRKELRENILAYVIINAVLLSIWAASGFGFPWPLVIMALWAWPLGALILKYYTEHGAGRARFEARITAEMAAELEPLPTEKRKPLEDALPPFQEDDVTAIDDEARRMSNHEPGLRD